MTEILEWEPVHPLDREPIWASAEDKQQYLLARKRSKAKRAVVATLRGGSALEMAGASTRRMTRNPEAHSRNKSGAKAKRPQSPYQPSGRYSYLRDLLAVAVADHAHSADPGTRGSWEASAFQGDRGSEHHGGIQDARNRLSLHSEAELRGISTTKSSRAQDGVDNATVGQA